MKKKIAVIEGDGIGPEVIREAMKVLNAVAEKFNHQFDYTYNLMGAIAIDNTGEPLPDDTVQNCLQSDAVLFGAIGDPKYDNNPSAKVRPEQGLLQLRKSLELYANVRPVSTFPSLQHLSPLKNKNIEGVDFIIYRELTGGIYFGEKTISPDGNSAIDVCNYSVDEIERIGVQAFEMAIQRRKKVTLVDKANVLETSRLWRKTITHLSKKFPQVALDFLFVDNASMQIILCPKQFDIILTENMFGDILSDEASVICGSLGLLPSASLGDKLALFEPIHGSYPQAAGKNIANPIGCILSAAMMMDYFKLNTEANLIREATSWVMENGFVTKDLNSINFYYTSTIGNIICDFIRGKNANNIQQEYIEQRKSTII